MPKVTIEMDGMTVVMTRDDSGKWNVKVSGDSNGMRNLTDNEAAATAALAMGVNDDELERQLYAIAGPMWIGLSFSPIP